jgi:hypothetical protein
MNRIKQLIKEVLSTPPKKDLCNCGCHTCENVGNKGPIINENLNAHIVMSDNMKHHITNKLSLIESHLPYGTEAFLNLWAEARYLYSREAIHVNEADKKILVESNLGEYGMYKGKKVPLDLTEQKHIFTLNKGKIKKTLNENSAEKLYKVEGLLVTNNDLLFQKELISDIRSITGVTTVDTREYTPRLPKASYSYNKLAVKIDPYPYLKNGKFDIETIKQIIVNINNIRGVVKFKVENPQMINIGV